jgi:hypothetical protein
LRHARSNPRLSFRGLVWIALMSFVNAQAERLLSVS